MGGGRLCGRRRGGSAGGGSGASRDAADARAPFFAMSAFFTVLATREELVLLRASGAYDLYDEGLRRAATAPWFVLASLAPAT